jgi:hypothetical protein
MAVQAACQVLRVASRQGSWCGHDLGELEPRRVRNADFVDWFAVLRHGLASFWFCDPSDRGRRKQGMPSGGPPYPPHGSPAQRGEGSGPGVDGPPAPPHERFIAFKSATPLPPRERRPSNVASHACGYLRSAAPLAATCSPSNQGHRAFGFTPVSGKRPVSITPAGCSSAKPYS